MAFVLIPNTLRISALSIVSTFWRISSLSCFLASGWVLRLSDFAFILPQDIIVRSEGSFEVCRSSREENNPYKTWYFLYVCIFFFLCMCVQRSTYVSFYPPTVFTHQHQPAVLAYFFRSFHLPPSGCGRHKWMTTIIKLACRKLYLI